MTRAPLTPAAAAGRNESFRASLAGLRFCFRCEDCAHYAPVGDRCSLEFDTAFLTTPEVRLVTDDGRLVFCKYFEMD